MEASCEGGQGPEGAVAPWMDGWFVYPCGDRPLPRLSGKIFPLRLWNNKFYYKLHLVGISTESKYSLELVSCSNIRRHRLDHIKNTRFHQWSCVFFICIVLLLTTLEGFKDSWPKKLRIVNVLDSDLGLQTCFTRLACSYILSIRSRAPYKIPAHCTQPQTLPSNVNVICLSPVQPWFVCYL